MQPWRPPLGRRLRSVPSDPGLFPVLARPLRRMASSPCSSAAYPALLPPCYDNAATSPSGEPTSHLPSSPPFGTGGSDRPSPHQHLPSAVPTRFNVPHPSRAPLPQRNVHGPWSQSRPCTHSRLPAWQSPGTGSCGLQTQDQPSPASGGLALPSNATNFPQCQPLAQTTGPFSHLASSPKLQRLLHSPFSADELTPGRQLPWVPTPAPPPSLHGNCPRACQGQTHHAGYHPGSHHLLKDRHCSEPVSPTFVVPGTSAPMRI